MGNVSKSKLCRAELSGNYIMEKQQECRVGHGRSKDHGVVDNYWRLSVQPLLGLCLLHLSLPPFKFSPIPLHLHRRLGHPPRLLTWPFHHLLTQLSPSLTFLQLIVCLFFTAWLWPLCNCFSHRPWWTHERYRPPAKHLMSQENLENLVHALIFNQLDYYHSIFRGLTKKQTLPQLSFKLIHCCLSFEWF